MRRFGWKFPGRESNTDKLRVGLKVEAPLWSKEGEGRGQVRALHFVELCTLPT